MEIEPDGSGGHMITHHFKDMPMHSSKSGMGMSYQEPDKKAFGASEGHDMLAHLANALHIQESDGKDNDDGVGKDGEYD